jgi:uncharacterized glyoxalase superfamily protein PhnB
MAPSAEPRLVTLLPIKRMKRALKFYTERLDAKVNMRGQGEMEDSWASITIGGSEIWLILPEKRERRKLSYTTLVTRNIKKYVAQLQRRGVRFQKAVRMSRATKVDGPIASEEFGSSAFFKDSEGNLLMIWQNSSAM